MLPTYRAVLTNDRVQWEDEIPSLEQPSSVMITILAPTPLTSQRSDGAKMAEALREVAARGGLSGIGDASQWQREQRTDRPLPGRGE